MKKKIADDHITLWELSFRLETPGAKINMTSDAKSTIIRRMRQKLELFHC